MRKKTLITILLSAVIWISAAVLAVTSVYRVSAVSLDLAHISVEAIAEGEEIERLLGEAYKTESMFKVNAKKPVFSRFISCLQYNFCVLK